VGIRRFFAGLIDGLGEGLAMASRYDALTRKNDSELARIGLKREDIPRAVFSARRR
jgi:hypothetical protein